ncbi:unnamed protein product [Linum tenue]|uniref:RNase H type-1 domain-containing protein n=1 Tax=Linum tenue TaxID=586396 RepID=A0AAV0ICZ4_9ROSI|nr:unnamed protein product [Linum tenue]CAI0555815.1 unnamed protein product [Linum tenue]
MITSSSPVSQPRDDHQQPCPPPTTLTRRIYCDGSFDPISREAAYGVVITNPHGQFVDGKAGRVVCSSPIETEAYALLEACKLAMREHVPSTIFSDCKALVDALKNHSDLWPWNCYAILSSIQRIIQVSNWINIAFTCRRNNKEADWIARNARLNTLHQDWLVVLNIISAFL